MSEVAYEIVDDVSDESRWLNLRSTGIGASEMAIVLGVSHWKHPLQLYAEKIGTVEPPKPKNPEALRLGKRLEWVILDEYRDRTGRPAEEWQQLVRSKAHPWAIATPDAKTANDNSTPLWPFELKTHSAFRAEDWIDGAPEAYRVQVHHQMLVAGAERATVACLIGGQKLAWCDVERDEALIRKIIYHGRLFWERVLNHEPPPIDGDPRAKEALRALYPIDDGSVVELPASMLDVVEELDAIKDDLKVLETKRRSLEVMIQEALGNAQTGVFAGSPLRITWKTQTRAGHTVAPGTTRVMRIHRPKGRAA